VYVCIFFEAKHTPEALFLLESAVSPARLDIVSVLFAHWKHFVSPDETLCFARRNKMFP